MDEKKGPGKTAMIVSLTCAALLFFAVAAHAFDFKVKYTIPTMKTRADADKIVAMMKALPGFKSADVFLEQQSIIYFYDNEKLENEKVELLIPLKKAGYRVARSSVLYEERENP